MHDRLYQYVRVYPSIYLYVHCDYIIFLFMQVHTSMYQYLLVCTCGLFHGQYVLVHTSTYCYIQVQSPTDTYIFDITWLNAFHGTREYMPECTLVGYHAIVHPGKNLFIQLY